MLRFLPNFLSEKSINTNMVTSKTIVFDDAIVDILKNDMLSFKPFLVRINGYNINYEMRFSEDDMKVFAESLTLMVTNER